MFWTLLYLVLGTIGALVAYLFIFRRDVSYRVYRASIFFFSIIELFRAPSHAMYRSLSTSARTIVRLMSYTIPPVKQGGRQRPPMSDQQALAAAAVADRETYAAMRERFSATTRSAYAPVPLSQPLVARVHEPARWIAEHGDTGCSYRLSNNGGDHCAPLLVHAHGGAFISGSALDYVAILQPWLCEHRFNALVVALPLVPEYTLDQVVDMFYSIYVDYCLKQYKPSQIFFSGDSSGGTIVLSTLVKLRDNGVKLPAGAILLSPWCDLTMSSASFNRRTHEDFAISWEYSRFLKKNNPCGKDVDPKLHSPLFMDLKQLPPLFISVGGAERFIDEVRELKEKLSQFGVETHYHEQQALFHGFSLLYNVMSEAKRAMDKAAEFIKSRLAELQD